MCTTCGCGSGETRIEGEALHAHEHRHADGTVHSHPHDHGHDHGHEHMHQHEHRHADGTVHSHPHDHGAAHGHGSAHEHAHQHAHEHRHADGTVHSHPHEHTAGHDHQHAHAHEHRHADGTVHSHPHPHAPGHEHEHSHEHSHDPAALRATPSAADADRMVRIEQDILAKNDALARDNRDWLAERGVFAVNLVSSPGSGKTTLLVRTIEALAGRRAVSVIEGDQQTSFDADRIRATGAPALQINTGKGCHLDAQMVGLAMRRLAPADGSVLMIENVGNLVCPAAFDLGEAHKVVVLSVTEGEDKPLKYPDMFAAADLMLLNKVDLLPHLSFDVARCVELARRVNPRIEVLQVSATRGDGMDEWLAWLERGAERARAAQRETVAGLREQVARLQAELAALKA